MNYNTETEFPVCLKLNVSTFQNIVFLFQQYYPIVKNQFLSSQIPLSGMLPSILTLLHLYLDIEQQTSSVHRLKYPAFPVLIIEISSKQNYQTNGFRPHDLSLYKRVYLHRLTYQYHDKLSLLILQISLPVQELLLFPYLISNTKF